MPWFKVDDTLAYHAKVVAAGNAAMGLWVRAGSWSAQQLTDGVVPKHVLATLGKPSEAKRLVDVGLWHDKGDTYEFHQWAENGRQPTRVRVEADREASRQRQQRGREAAARRRAEEEEKSA